MLNHNELIWQSLPQDLQLSAKQVHLIKVFIPDVFSNFRDYWDILTESEQERALQISHQATHYQFVLGRGILRSLLSHYLKATPREITFDVTNHGKLNLSRDFYSQELQFNLSHSGNCILYALSLHDPIGVDVEYPKEHVSLLEIAKRFFSETEYQALIELPLQQHKEGFYNAWTRKEAFIKAIGEGLSFPLKDFNVTLKPDDLPQIVSIHNSKREAKRWTMASFTPFEDYFAAFTIRQLVEEVFYFQWVE